MSEITPEMQARFEEILGRSLGEGSHSSLEDGMCAMEAVSYVAGEPWSDAPQCASPVIAAFVRAWNDSLQNDAERDRLLKPLIPKLIGTKSTATVEERRSYMALDWLIRVHTPMWLARVDSLKPHATALRNLEEIADMAGAVTAGERVRAARAAAEAAVGATAWDAARNAAWAAARTTAWDAVGAAAGDAAWDAVGAAAGATAWDAVGAAAGDAAWAAARAAAGDAAWDALRPTVAELQVSALALIDRMIDVRNG